MAQKNIASDNESYSEEFNEANFDARIDSLASQLLHFQPRSARKGKSGRPSKEKSQITDSNAQSLFFTELLNEIRTLHSKFDSFSVQISEMKSIIEEKDKALASLKKESDKKDVKIAELERRVDSLERKEREDYLVVTGPAINTSAPNLEESVKNIISSCTRIHPNKLNFTAKKLGNSRTQALLKLKDATLKTDLFRAFRTMKPKDMYINEYLTPANYKLAAELRKLKREKGLIHSVFTFHGQVYVKKSPDGNKILMQTLQDFDKLNSPPNTI